MEGLAIGKQDIVGHIDDVVDGAATDGGELAFQPFGTFANLAALNSHAAVAGAGFGVFHHDVDGQIV